MLMLDGEHMVQRCVVVPLAITAVGTKKPVVLPTGNITGNQYHRQRGRHLRRQSPEPPIGTSKAQATDPQCQYPDALLVGPHTYRACRPDEGRLTDNVTDQLPDNDKDLVEAKLVKAFGHPDPRQGLRNTTLLAAQLDKSHPGAAASLREGLDEMFTHDSGHAPRPTRYPMTYQRP